MIPQGGSKFAPWLTLTEGMIVKITSEAGPKDNPKLKSPFYCDVTYNKETYTVSLNWASYARISEVFGADTEAWIGQEIRYDGIKPIKTKMGTVKGHIWSPIVKEINLDKTPF